MAGGPLGGDSGRINAAPNPSRDPWPPLLPERLLKPTRAQQDRIESFADRLRLQGLCAHNGAGFEGDGVASNAIDFRSERIAMASVNRGRIVDHTRRKSLQMMHLRRTPSVS